MRSNNLLLAIAVLAATGVQAQIITDTSFGRVSQSLAGPNYLIPQDLGHTAGRNLFHSFLTFNILDGESAVFGASPDIGNIITRITGGTPSLINGALSVDAQGGSPHFYFVNPSGVVFGAGASIDVPGGFHVATADYVTFADGRMYADPSRASTFSSAPPEAFGFLPDNRGTIYVGASLSVPAMQPMNLIATDVRVENATLSAAGGELRIMATGGRDIEVPVSGPLPRGDGFITMLEGAKVQSRAVDGQDASPIRLSGGTILVDGGLDAPEVSGISSSGNGSGRGADIEIAASGLLAISNFAQVGTQSGAASDGGNIRISAGSMSIDGSFSTDDGLQFLPAGVFAGNPYAGGRAGRIDIDVAGNLALINGGAISNSGGGGLAGNTRVAAGSMVIDGGALGSSTGIFISGQTAPDRTLSVNVRNRLFIAGGGSIASSAVASGSDPLQVNAGSLVINGANSEGTGILSGNASGRPGAGSDISVHAADIQLLDGGAIQSKAISGDGGAIYVSARDITIVGTDATRDKKTGIISDSDAGAVGNAGSLNVTATGTLRILNTGQISSDTASDRNAGTVNVTAGEIFMKGTAENTSFISSDTLDGSTGNAGAVSVRAAGNITLDDGGAISSDTRSSGSAGSVTVRAGGQLALVGNGSYISSDTEGSGNAGKVSVSAGSLLVRQTADKFTGISSDANGGSSGNAGLVEIDVAGLALVDNGAVSSRTFGTGNAGVVDLRAGQLVVSNAGRVSSSSFGPGHAGAVHVQADRVDILSSGFISSSSNDTGSAGVVTVAARDILIDGARNPSAFTGISSASNVAQGGDAGDVTVTATGSLAILNGGVISSATYGHGRAGNVAVSAPSVVIDGGGFNTLTGVTTSSSTAAAGAAGNITIVAPGTLVLRNGGGIQSLTRSASNAGEVEVTAGSLVIDGGNYPFLTGISTSTIGGQGNAGTVAVTADQIAMTNDGLISSSTYGAGNAGNVRITTRDLSIDGAGAAYATGILSRAEPGSRGRGGSIAIQSSGTVRVWNDGQISSATLSTGDAGSVQVVAHEIDLDGGRISSVASTGSSGNGGSVVVQAGDIDIHRGGNISASTSGSGDAGHVQVNVGDLTIDREGSSKTTGIFSVADGSAGSAGTVSIAANGLVAVRGGGEIATSTSTRGSAGSIEIAAQDIVVDGRLAGTPSSINAAALAGSSGQTGSVTLQARGSITVADGGEISIRNDARSADPSSIRPTVLRLEAPDIVIRDGGTVSAASTGNIGASDIEIDSTHRLLVEDAAVLTTARDGNGGSITVTGDIMELRNGQITSSVTGSSGNGGDIRVQGNALVMETGFIQANTVAARARGGNVFIDVKSLVTSGSLLDVGGTAPLVYQPGVFGLNVIQAAAPEGLGGTIGITSPSLDIAAAITVLKTSLLDSGGLARSRCAGTGTSSFAQAGWGGIGPIASGLLGSEILLDRSARNPGVARSGATSVRCAS